MATITETFSHVNKLVRHAIGAATSGIRAGDDKMASRDESIAGPHEISLSSSTFNNGQAIPESCTPAGANISPDLSWSGVPNGTRELVLICEDPDAPMTKPFVHWMIHGLPAQTNSLPKDLPKHPVLNQLGGAKQGSNDAKQRGWYGPRPPLGHGVHHYHFQLFALDTTLNLAPDATRDELAQAMRGHVIAEGEIVGTFERRADDE